jgi:hypothetical protein
MTTSVRSEDTRSIVAVNGVDRLAINSDGSMELLTPASNPSGNDVPTVGQLPFTRYWDSPEQTMSGSSVAYTLSHTLGVVPTLVQYMYVCKTASAGYSIGDVLFPASCFDSNATSSSQGWCATLSSASIYVRQGGSPLLLLDKATGAVVSYATLVANFKLIVRAWA